MSNLELYNRARQVPDEAKKAIGAGRLKGMTDINPMWRIKKLTEEFGVCGIGWKYVIKEKRLEKGCKEQISAFVDIDLFIKVEGVWSDAIQGTGGASFVTAETAGLYQSDECFKMALTDAISVACKALGFGADVYYQKDRTKYDQEEGSKTQPTTPKPIEPPKRETPTLSEALGEVAIATTSDKVAEIWAKYPQFKKEESFIKAVKEKGESFKNK